MNMFTQMQRVQILMMNTFLRKTLQRLNMRKKRVYKGLGVEEELGDEGEVGEEVGEGAEGKEAQGGKLHLKRTCHKPMRVENLQKSQ